MAATREGERDEGRSDVKFAGPPPPLSRQRHWSPVTPWQAVIHPCQSLRVRHDAAPVRARWGHTRADFQRRVREEPFRVHSGTAAARFVVARRAISPHLVSLRVRVG